MKRPRLCWSIWVCLLEKSDFTREGGRKMKRIIIMMSLAFLTLALSGCGKSEEDKCKDKGWYWNESTKECKETAPEGTPAPAAETQESCKSKEGYVWNAGSSQCKKVDYFMLIHSKEGEASIRRVLVQLKKPNEFFASVYKYLLRGKCVKIPMSSLSYLAVKVNTPDLVDVCSGSATAKTKCELGVYKLVLGEGNTQPHLQSVTLDVERTDCELLEVDSDN